MDEFWDYLKLKPLSMTVHHTKYLNKAFNSTPKFRYFLLFSLSGPRNKLNEMVLSTLNTVKNYNYTGNLKCSIGRKIHSLTVFEISCFLFFFLSVYHTKRWDKKVAIIE